MQALMLNQITFIEGWKSSMNTQLSTKSKGFTIIEVVLVLAIAGLIFLMVFIALPALQRSQRDTQRRNDASTFASQLVSYQTNNRGNLPMGGSAASAQTFATNYLKWKSDMTGEFNDPSSGKGYIFVNTPADLDAAGEVYFGGAGSSCNGETPVAPSATNDQRNAAVAFKLEGSGIFCKSVK